MEIKLRKELKFEKVLPLSEIKDNQKSIDIYGKNENVDDLVDSMKEIGFDIDHPIILNETNTIISGHRRAHAALKVGLKEVPVKIYKYADELTEWQELLNENTYRIKSDTIRYREMELQKYIFRKLGERNKIEGVKLGGQIGGGDHKSVEFKNSKEDLNQVSFNTQTITNENQLVDKSVNELISKNDEKIQTILYIPDKINTRKEIAQRMGISEGKLGYMDIAMKRVKELASENKIEEAQILETLINTSAKVAAKIVKEKLENKLITPEIKTKQDNDISAEKILLELRKDARKEAQKIEYELSNKDVHGEWVITESQDVLKCDVVITDPPYGITDNIFDLVDIEKFTKDWLTRWNNCGADFIVSFWSQEYLWLGKQWFDDCLSNYTFQQLLIWHYPNNKKPQSRQMFKQTYEPIYFYRRKDCEKEVKISSTEWGEGLTNFDCHIAATPQSNFTEMDFQQHPTQKPVSVMAWLVNSLSKPGELICDPFCGVGTTGIPAIRTKRKFYGIEINPEYIQIAKERLTKYDIQ